MLHNAVWQSTGESEESLRNAMRAVASSVFSIPNQEKCNFHDPVAPPVPQDVAVACVVLAPRYPRGIVVVEVPREPHPGAAWHFPPLLPATQDGEPPRCVERSMSTRRLNVSGLNARRYE